MTAPAHHPSDDVLAGYAAGTLAHGFAVVVAAHLTFCPACRGRSARLETIGGTLLDGLPDAALPEDLRAAVFARLDEPAPAPAPFPTPVDAQDATHGLVPAPIRALLRGGLADLSWRSGGQGLELATIGPAAPGFRQRLVRGAPGAALPQHTHEGEEMTIILAGAYDDGIARYAPGDFAHADADVDHRPKAEPGAPCICYIVTDAPLRLTGPIGRHLNRFVDM